jgi:hypothetical protein
MPDQAIKCPQCGAEIPLSEALTAQIEQSLKLKYDAEVMAKDKEIQAKLKEINQQKKILKLKTVPLKNRWPKKLKPKEKQYLLQNEKKYSLSNLNTQKHYKMN